MSQARAAEGPDQVDEDEAKAKEVEEAKAKVRETAWLNGYTAAAKAQVKLVAQDFDGVLKIICIKGGLITTVEGEEPLLLLGVTGAAAT